LRQGAWLAAHLPDATPTVNPSTGICPPCTASGTTSSATLTWKAVAGTVSGYRVYVWDALKLYTRTITVGTGTSTIVNSLPVGNTYYFAVTAYNSAGESASSNVVSKTIQ